MADEEFLRAESVLRELISEMEKFRSAHASLEMASVQAGSLILGIENLCSRAAGLLETVQKSSPSVARSAELLNAQASQLTEQIKILSESFPREMALVKEQAFRSGALSQNQLSQLTLALERLENNLSETKLSLSRLSEEWRVSMTPELSPWTVNFEDLNAKQRDLQDQVSGLERVQASFQESIGLMGSRLLSRYSKISGALIVLIILQVISLAVLVLR